jgi:hypothetical protein
LKRGERRIGGKGKRKAYGVLLVVIIVLDGESRSWNYPAPADGHLLWIIATPDLNLGNLRRGESFSFQYVVEIGTRKGFEKLVPCCIGFCSGDALIFYDVSAM